jgi:hypothetical protein
MKNFVENMPVRKLFTMAARRVLLVSAVVAFVWLGGIASRSMLQGPKIEERRESKTLTVPIVVMPQQVLRDYSDPSPRFARELDSIFPKTQE